MGEKYIFRDDEEIIYYVYSLNWHNPRGKQTYAAKVLLDIPYEKTHLLLPKYAKECWENAVKVIKKIGYPQNEKVLPTLASQIEDINWPGSKEVISIFKDIGPEISVRYIEPECKKAIESKDIDWMYFLLIACKEIGIKSEIFNDRSKFLKMKKETEDM